MSNEHIEYFKRFAVAHMRWINFEFDRIVADVIKKDAKIEAKRKNTLKMKSLMNGLPEYQPSEDFVFDFDRDVKFGIKVINLGMILNLKA